MIGKIKFILAFSTFVLVSACSNINKSLNIEEDLTKRERVQKKLILLDILLNTKSNLDSDVLSNKKSNLAPSIPTNLQILQSSNDVTLKWNQSVDSDGFITGYEISNDDGKNWTKIGNKTSYIFNELNETHTYSFKVRAKDNDNHYSPLFNRKLTFNAIIPEAPVNLTPEPIGENDIELKWNSPDTTDVNIIGYEVSKDNGENWITIEKESNTPLETSYIFTNLIKGKKYKFLARTLRKYKKNKSKLTHSPATEAILKLGNKIPSTPTNLSITSKSKDIIFTWNKSIDTDGFIDRYEVSKDNGKNWISTEKNTRYTFEGKRGRTYILLVKAKDNDGSYSPIKSKNIKFGNLAPSIPTNFLANQTDSTSIMLTWNKSRDIDGFIDHYKVSKDNGTTWDNSAMNSTHTFIDLRLGNNYDLQVKAIDNENLESQVARIQFTLPLAATSASGASSAPNKAPSTPSNLNIISTNTEITLTWSASEDNDGSIDDYEVSINNGETWIRSGTDDLSHTFTGLTPIKTYTLSVRAKDNDGAYSSVASKQGYLLFAWSSLSLAWKKAIARNVFNIAENNLPQELSQAQKDAIFQLKSFTYIAYGDKIQSLAPFKYLKNLETINLKLNNITSIKNGDFIGLDKLKTLLLYYNCISNIEYNAFDGLKNLNLLNLQGNAISRLTPGAFKGLDKLTVLALQKNQLKEIKKGTFADLKSLTGLALGQNGITNLKNIYFEDLPDSFELLYLNNTPELKKISKEDYGTRLTQLYDLKLVLWNNEIESLDNFDFSSFSNSSFLLDLSYNRITTISAEDFDNKMPAKIGFLYLDHNKITSIETGKCGELFILTLSHNIINNIDLTKCTDLGVLIAANTQITNIDFISNLKSLYFLLLYNNKINSIKNNTFTSMNNLRALYIYGQRTSSGTAYTWTQEQRDNIRSQIMPKPRFSKYPTKIYFDNRAESVPGTRK